MIEQNLHISNPKPDLHNINVHSKFGENPLMCTQVIIRKQNMDGRTTNELCLCGFFWYKW